jgi:hypothetical protein
MARIERLVKASLLVCPPSSVHRSESSLDTRLRDALRRLHLYLSGDSRLVNHEQVKREQLYASFCAWLDGAEAAFPVREEVLRLRDGWPDLLQVSSTYALDAVEIDAIRSGRLVSRDDFQAHAQAWASQTRTFTERRAEQLAAYGPSYRSARRPMSELWVLTRHAMDERSIAPDRWAHEVEQFLCSEGPRRTPFAQLASGVLASMGWLAEHSQGITADTGTRDDVQAFATYAPFCDAFTVDRRFAHILRKTPMAQYLPAELTIFAANELSSLENWLIEIERTAPPGHFELVSDIYGPEWLEPFAGILGSVPESSRAS